MTKIEHQKIVRDRIPEIIEKQGEKAQFTVLNHEESVFALQKKLQEELNEYLEAPCIEELADLVEVVRGILFHRNSSWDDLEAVRAQKYAKRGGFEGGIFLKSVEKE